MAPVYPASQVHGIAFEDALRACKAGKRIQRAGWHGRNMWVAVCEPAAHSEMRRPFLFISGEDGRRVPWNPDQLDLLTDDWRIL